MRCLQGSDLKTDKCPGHQQQQCQHRTESRQTSSCGLSRQSSTFARICGTRCSKSARSESGEELSPVKVRHGHQRQDHRSRKQDNGKGSLNTLHERLFADQQDADHHQHRHGERNLSGKDSQSPDFISGSDQGQIAEHNAADDKERGCVQKDDRQIRKAQKPGAQKCVVASESFFGICVDAALAGSVFHQPGIIVADHQHQCSAQQHGFQCSGRPGNRQKSRPRHDKSTPAHSAPECNRPDVYRQEISRHFTSLYDRLYLLLLFRKHTHPPCCPVLFRAVQYLFHAALCYVFKQMPTHPASDHAMPSTS